MQLLCCTFASCRTLLLHFHYLFPSLCGLSMFKTLYNVLNTCHFLKSSKSLHVSAWIGHPQVLIVFFKKIAVILFSHARSSLCFWCACVCTHQKQRDIGVWEHKLREHRYEKRDAISEPASTNESVTNRSRAHSAYNICSWGRIISTVRRLSGVYLKRGESEQKKRMLLKRATSDLPARWSGRRVGQAAGRNSLWAAITSSYAAGNARQTRDQRDGLRYKLNSYSEFQSPVGHRSSLTLYCEPFAFNESVMQANESPLVSIYTFNDWRQLK
jgi:hypothetical protein